MPDHSVIHCYQYQDCVLRIPSDVLAPKSGGLLDRIIHQAPDYLNPQDRLVYCGQKE